MKEALFYERRREGAVVCGLCPHSCLIFPGKVGLCGVRRNINEMLFAESYGCISSLSLDPIEKKPLKRFYPGSLILSVGCYGCNMKCAYCQNYSISRQKPETKAASPEELLQIAEKTAGNIGIAFTYNEPIVGVEYVLDAASLFKDAGLKVVLVTNGMINEAPLESLLPYTDAMNIDVKAFSAARYKDLCGDLATVVKTVEKCAAVCHVEITSLIVPGQNDGVGDMQALAEWLAGISPEIPLHVSRFFPRYKMPDGEPTPVETMKTLAGTARKYLKYVHLGNV